MGLMPCCTLNSPESYFLAFKYRRWQLLPSEKIDEVGPVLADSETLTKVEQP